MSDEPLIPTSDPTEAKGVRYYYDDPHRLTQAEAAYIPISTSAEQACANCRFYRSEGNCQVVQGGPSRIVSNGWCNEWTAETVIPDPAIQEAAEQITSGMLEFMGFQRRSAAEGEPPVPAATSVRAVLDDITSALKRMGRDLIAAPQPEEGGFRMLTEADKKANPKLANSDWIAWWSNNFKDLEDEIISAKAIDTFIEETRTGKAPMPELWFAHIPGTAHGRASKLYRVGHFAIALGSFDDTALTKRMKRWYTENAPITMSHGFRYDPAQKQNGVYYYIRTHELTTLRKGLEANPYTKFTMGDTKTMSVVTPEQRALLEKELGAEWAGLVANAADNAGKQLRDLDVQFKSKAMYGDDDEDKEDDDKTLSSDTLLVLSGIRAMREELNPQLDAVKTNTERLDAVETEVRGIGDKIDRIAEGLNALSKGAPAASKSGRTVVPDSDPHANFIQEKNESGAANVPIFNQMKNMGGFQMPPVDLSEGQTADTE